MAIVTTYEQVGIKEDISDVITTIDPTNTPFQSMLKTEKVHNTLFQWQEDHLRSAALNAQSDGFTAADPASYIYTNMRSNRTQILTKVARVSGSADAISTYGRAKELAYQLAKAGAEIKRDLELSLVGNAQTQVAGNDTAPGAGTARQFDSYQAQILTAALNSTLPTKYSAFNSSFSTFGGGTAALSEDLVLTLDAQLYNNGSEATVMMVKPNDAIKVANFAYKAPASASNTAGRTTYVQNSETKLINVVDFYRSPYGEKKVVMNRFQKSTDCMLFDPKMWNLAVLRPWFRETLAKTGDNTAVMIVGEFSLKHRNFGASGFITDLS
jgi:hypothetical protein